MSNRNDFIVSIQIKFYLSALYLTLSDFPFSKFWEIKMLGVGFIEYSKEHDYGEQFSNLEDIKGASVQVALLIYSTQRLDFITFIFIISIFCSQYDVYELKAIWEAKVKHKFRENSGFFLPMMQP